MKFLTMNRIVGGSPIFREGDGGGGSGGQQTQGDNKDEEFEYIDNILDDHQGAGNESGDEGEISLDPNNVLGDLFKVEDAKEGDEGEKKPPANQTGSNRPTTEQVQQEIQNLLGNMRLPDDIIPEDFNAGDPASMRSLLTNVQRQTAQQTLGIVLRPVQHAMEVQMDAIENLVQTRLNELVGQNDQKRTLETEFPIVVSNPGVRSVVEMIFNQSKSRHKGDTQQAIASTRKALQAMGINYRGGGAPSGNAGGGGGNRSEGAGVRTGASALDSFAPLPRRGVQGRMGSR